MRGKCCICNKEKDVKDYSYLFPLIAPICKSEMKEILYCEECLQNFEEMINMVKKDWGKNE